MYLTRVKLDLTKRKTLVAFRSPNIFHGTLERAFVDRGKRHLWRIDSLHGTYYLLFTSNEIPDLHSFVTQFGAEPYEKSVETKNYQTYIGEIKAGDRLRFRLTANPTACSALDGARGKVHAHITPKYQKEWLMRKSDKCGFSLTDTEYDVKDSHWLYFKKHDSKVSLLAASFEGILTVTDPSLFRESLSSGIGRGKAYGMGMMTVIRI